MILIVFLINCVQAISIENVCKSMYNELRNISWNKQSLNLSLLHTPRVTYVLLDDYFWQLNKQFNCVWGPINDINSKWNRHSYEIQVAFFVETVHGNKTIFIMNDETFCVFKLYDNKEPVNEKCGQLTEWGLKLTNYRVTAVYNSDIGELGIRRRILYKPYHEYRDTLFVVQDKKEPNSSFCKIYDFYEYPTITIKDDHCSTEMCIKICPYTGANSISSSRYITAINKVVSKRSLYTDIEFHYFSGNDVCRKIDHQKQCRPSPKYLLRCHCEKLCSNCLVYQKQMQSFMYPFNQQDAHEVCRIFKEKYLKCLDTECPSIRPNPMLFGHSVNDRVQLCDPLYNESYFKLPEKCFNLIYRDSHQSFVNKNCPENCKQQHCYQLMKNKLMQISPCCQIHFMEYIRNLALEQTTKHSMCKEARSVANTHLDWHYVETNSINCKKSVKHFNQFDCIVNDCKAEIIYRWIIIVCLLCIVALVVLIAVIYKTSSRRSAVVERINLNAENEIEKITEMHDLTDEEVEKLIHKKLILKEKARNK